MMLQNNKTLIKVICLAIMSRILLLPAPSNLYSLRDFAEVDNKFSKLDIHVLGTSKLKVPLIYYHSGILFHHFVCIDFIFANPWGVLCKKVKKLMTVSLKHSGVLTLTNEQTISQSLVCGPMENNWVPGGKQPGELWLIG